MKTKKRRIVSANGSLKKLWAVERTKGNLGAGWHLMNGWRIGNTMPERKHRRKLSYLEKTTCAMYKGMKVQSM